MIVDVHAHFVPKSAINELSKRGCEFDINLIETEPGCYCCRFPSGLQVRPFFESLSDVSTRIAEMDQIGIDRQVLTIWTDIFGYELSPTKGHQWHQILNDTLGELCVSHSDKFSWMASGALQNAGLAAQELERAMKFGAIGGVVAAHIDGKNLGECDLDEYWATCVKLKAPVFIHPVNPVPSIRERKFSLSQIVAYTSDTSLTVGSLISAGVLDKFPDLKLILSHGGGGLPWLIGRFDRMYQASSPKMTGTICKHTPSSYLKRMYYDTILHSDIALQYLRQTVGIDQMVIGTDAPFPPGDPDPLGILQKSKFSEEEIITIGEINPKKLFGESSLV
ncbi:MAG: hypothetical protein CMM44_09215 [Rhodospirillaceae bacterium]|nr:hypothetical protein [Rhodospirillaceae bacterium]|tara:strand:+ start:5446 stop:6450 length:1005 start_codon:yes stop_codon:yes gene_type:complete